MHNKSLCFALGLAVLLALAIGCAKAPDDQVTITRSVLDSVQVAEVEKYAPEQYRAAKDSLDAAMAEIEKQNSKFTLTRRYGKAEAQLEAAQDLARTAAEQAVAKKEALKAEAQDLLTQMQAELEQAKTLIAQAPRGKGEAAAVQSISSDIAQLEVTATEVSNAMAQEDYVGAHEMAKAGLEKIQSINTELKTAIEKKKGTSKSG
jgi:hypothetical protein